MCVFCLFFLVGVSAANPGSSTLLRLFVKDALKKLEHILGQEIDPPKRFIDKGIVQCDAVRSRDPKFFPRIRIRLS